MPIKIHETGAKGEDLAAKYLEKLGYKVVNRNYLKKCGEIDIVARMDDQLCFIEVKTVTRDVSCLTSNDGYQPEDNVHLWKKERLARVIQIYLEEKKVSDEIDWQCDVVSVYLDKEGNLLKIDRLEDILLSGC